MPDDSNELRATLARLHEQLSGSPNVSAETRALLAGVAADIDALLETDAGASAPAAAESQEPASIIQRLSSAEREFEVTHPTLSGIVGSLIDAVGRMGI